jgi:hypothetical protein
MKHTFVLICPKFTPSSSNNGGSNPSQCPRPGYSDAYYRQDNRLFQKQQAIPSFPRSDIDQDSLPTGCFCHSCESPAYYFCTRRRWCRIDCSLKDRIAVDLFLLRRRDIPMDFCRGLVVVAFVGSGRGRLPPFLPWLLSRVVNFGYGRWLPNSP